MSQSDRLSQALAGRYRIDREIGRGGMATVYLGRDLKHERPVAIKTLSPDLSAAIGQRFLREIDVIAKLNHPHVIPLFDSGRAGGIVFYVMPYIAGESLRARLDRERQLPFEDAVRLAREIAGALAHAHQHGIVHRDIKPENILLADGVALVADFGIARALVDTDAGAATQLATGMGTILGTPQYMSPEQVSGEHVDARSDVYALACVLYEMLAGQPPFVASTAAELMRLHLTAVPRSVHEYRASLPPGLTVVLAKGLAKVPADRYASAAQFSEAVAMATSVGVGPAGSASIVPSNLPKPRTRFIGREKELAAGARLLAETRLLTLTGIGGSGKTRFALELAARSMERHADGVWFVDLAPLTDASFVAEAIAARLSVRDTPGKTLRELLVERVTNKRLLLVLDNCEHVLTAVAELGDTLLTASETLTILATSREGLAVEGERHIALRSLGLPPERGASDLETLAASEAVELFLDRARLASDGFRLMATNAGAIAEICRRLDGIPLAIELAAARVKMLSVDQIRSKLDDRFRLLVGGRHSAVPRHQTLQATIQWSYDQLALDEQTLFRALSVFPGGWSLDVVTRLHGPEADAIDVMDRLGRLIDKSLVVVDRDRHDEPRYSLLETVRQYAQERSVDANESEAQRARFVDVMLELAERAYQERFVREAAWSEQLEIEHDNLRAAIDLVDRSDPERCLQLVGALAWFFQTRSYFVEGRELLTRAVAATAAAPARPARARALWGVANTLTWQGDGASALTWMEEALAMWRVLGDRREIALALEGIGWAQLLASNDEAGCHTFEESLELFRSLGDPYLVNRAMVALAQALVALHRVDEARPMARQIIEFSSTHSDERNEHFGWHYLADCALVEHKCDESLGLYHRSLALARKGGDRLEISFEVQGVAMSLAGLGDAARALRLAGAVHAEWKRLGIDLHIRFWDELLNKYLGLARRDLDAAAAERAWDTGMSMSFDAAIEDALSPATG
jgi:predicted ATPase